MDLLLASTSTARRALLERAGFAPRCRSPGVDEAGLVGPNPTDTSRLRAVAKAAAVSDPDAVVVGADQVVHAQGRLFGKPADGATHARMLRDLRGLTHRLTTSVAVCAPRPLPVIPGEATDLQEADPGAFGASGPPQHWCLFSVTTAVTVRSDLSEEEIRWLVASGEGRGSAGGYEIENRGIRIVERVEGDWTNILGLPLVPLLTILRPLGLDAPGVGASSLDGRYDDTRGGT